MVRTLAGESMQLAPVLAPLGLFHLMRAPGTNVGSSSSSSSSRHSRAIAGALMACLATYVLVFLPLAVMAAMARTVHSTDEVLELHRDWGKKANVPDGAPIVLLSFNLVRAYTLEESTKTNKVSFLPFLLSFFPSFLPVFFFL